jgi:hypothetical protein
VVLWVSGGFLVAAAGPLIILGLMAIIVRGAIAVGRRFPGSRPE